MAEKLDDLTDEFYLKVDSRDTYYTPTNWSGNFLHYLYHKIEFSRDYEVGCLGGALCVGLSQWSFAAADAGLRPTPDITRIIVAVVPEAHHEEDDDVRAPEHV